MDLFDQKVDIVENDNSIISSKNYNVFGTIVTQNGITTKIAKSCSSECLVTLTATWSAIPTINSYDVIGFRVSDVMINSINKATIKGDNYSLTYQPTSAKKLNNGFGYSVKLGGVSNMKISTSMYTSTVGKIYGSYQHAKSNVSLATSKLYTISAGGYGGVFDSYSTAIGKYNNAVGVDIIL